ncbi:MAG: AmmeMemoRadiSam system protein A [Candidatus Tectomicrobia bacterium]|uniref:AmmeMemoRadiSam system protein A n=1 Tax=Tectimicrobiota bacterium TaxID=2528274 RepID=A0A933GMR4_UNCTE|nr:AmmeMemoRadiSam system protein A [Candidatus Tectomicrobia bacterium]
MLQFGFFRKKDPKGQANSSNSREHRVVENSSSTDSTAITTPHPYVQLARETIERYIKKGDIIKCPDPLPEKMQGRAGVFVSLKKKGKLRGCIGTFQATQLNIAEEIIHNAISSSAQDPRFPPVTADEIAGLEISVDILSPPETVKDIRDLDPKKYGVIVTQGWRRGLLLPDLEGVDTVQEQLSIVRQKAGIAPYEEIEIMRFEVRRFK